jgi:hypothetical protein
MSLLTGLASVALILLVLVDGFEVVVLPRRVMRPYRFTRFFYRNTWLFWRNAGRWLRTGKHRETFLSLFGPLSLLALFGTWMVGLIVGFSLLHWSLRTPLNAPEGQVDFGTYLYLSGVTFFTLGYGDVTPLSVIGRALTVMETGLGFGFLACVISYLPVLYQAFSRREVPISLLDARAGSPPSAGQLLLRMASARRLAGIQPILGEWERWAAELLESHLSYPVLSYYRSQHDNQSWIATLTMVLDTSALLITAVKESDPYQAQLTFAMARHAAVDLALVFRTPPREIDRLPPAKCRVLRETLKAAGLELRESPGVEARLIELRSMYEPFVNALAEYFLHALPPFLPEQVTTDNWQTSAWTRRTPGIGNLPATDDEHFG